MSEGIEKYMGGTMLSLQQQSSAARDFISLGYKLKDTFYRLSLERT